MKKLICLMVLFFIVVFPALAQTESAPILFWHHYADPERAEFWQTLADEFNTDHPQTPVTVQYYPSYLQQHDAILTGLLNGSVPDVAFVRNYDAALYQLSDSLVDLNLLLADSSITEADFYPYFWEQDEFQNQRLGLPLTRSAEALYINLDLLDELPQNRAEWTDLACDFPIDIRLDASFWLGMSHIKNWRAQPASLIENIQWMQNLMAQGCAQIVPDAQFRFVSGQTAFYLDSTSARPFIEASIGDYLAEPFPMILLPLPSGSGYVANWYGVSLSIFQSNPEREAATWEWVEWLAQPEQMARWAEINGAFPVRQDVPYGEEWQVFAEAIPYIESNDLGYDLIRDELSFGLGAIFAGEDLQTRLQSILETTEQIEQAFEGQEP